MTDSISNRKAADRLAAMRDQSRVLEAEEELLRQGFISGDLSTEGDEFTVVVETKINERIDGRAMREHVDEAIWRPYLISTSSVYVTTRKRGDVVARK